PNGAGKSTVLNAIAQAVPYTGEVLLFGQDVRRMKTRERAQKMGALTQNHAMGYAFTVEEIVRLGRYAYAGAFSGSSEADEIAVRDALRFTGMEPLRAHSVLTLSGGELQRAFLSQLFAQNPPLLLLDEPTNHLDLAYQKQAFELIRHWLTQPGRAAVSVVHDLSLALAYGTHALLMDQGHTVALGTAREALSRENLQQAYGMDIHSWMRGMLSQWT
ncbi:MAG: ABC transporter ATP-binding protein, partial [Eubacteriales bacterium]|nr:ABC transporter ATP-binding protein [Eubacteriales bacterium]